jgi:hypothetical protein
MHPCSSGLPNSHPTQHKDCGGRLSDSSLQSQDRVLGLSEMISSPKQTCPLFDDSPIKCGEQLLSISYGNSQLLCNQIIFATMCLMCTGALEKLHTSLPSLFDLRRGPSIKDTSQGSQCNFSPDTCQKVCLMFSSHAEHIDVDGAACLDASCCF